MAMLRWIVLVLVVVASAGCGQLSMSSDSGAFDSELTLDQATAERGGSIRLTFTLRPRVDARLITTRFIPSGAITSSDSLSLDWTDVARDQPLVASINVQAAEFGDGNLSAKSWLEPSGDQGMAQGGEVGASFFVTNDHIHAGQSRLSVRRAALDEQHASGQITDEAYTTLRKKTEGSHSAQMVASSIPGSLHLSPGSSAHLTIELLDLCPGQPVTVVMTSSGVLEHSEPVTWDWQYDDANDAQRLVIKTTMRITGQGRGQILTAADSVDNQPCVGGLLQDQFAYDLDVGPTDATQLDNREINRSSSFLRIEP
jgi:hypothetical protein